jgi:hypothetical protein
MSHDSLFTSYRRYKEDTDYIACWLTTTAKRCGFVTTQGDPQKPVEKPKKLKGRARTLARRHAAANADNPKSTTPSATYTIAIKDFLPMAQYISSFSKPPVKVPEEFIRVIERAISLRQKVSKAMANPRYSGSSRSATDLASDSRHAYFVEILIDVRHTLAHLITEKSRRDPGPQKIVTRSKTDFDFANMFECLSVDDLSASEPVNDGNTSGQHLQKEKAYVPPVLSCKAEHPTDSLEASVGFFCLLRDLQQMREVISECWKDYQRGTIDLTAAALTSNAAFELACRMEEDLDDLAGYEGPESLLKSQHAMLCERLRELPEYTDLPDDDFEFATHHTAPEAFLWPAYKHLRYFLDIGCMRTMFNVPGDIHKPESDRSKMTEQQRFLEDRRLLGDAFSDITVYMGGQETHRDSHNDELTRGFLNMFYSGRVSLWLAFATQVFLDIHQTLREDVSNSFELLQHAGNTIVGAMADQVEYHQDRSKEPLPPFAHAFCHLSGIIYNICETDLLEMVRGFTDLFEDGQIEKFRLLKMNPISCGIKLYAIKAMYRHVTFESISGCADSILACAHLNNALVQEGYVQSRWPDMDFVHTIQNESHMYAGAAPKNPDDYYKRFCLTVLGFSVTNFARNRRRPHDIALKPKRCRTLEKRTPISDAFFFRYCFDMDRKNLSAQDLQDILATSKRQAVAKASEGEEALVRDIVIPKVAGRDAKASKKTRSAAAPKISPVNVLRKLRASLHAESLELSLDYMAMHRICTQLLISVRNAVAVQMNDMYGVVPGHERGLSSVVFFILSVFVAEKGKSKVNILPFRKDHYEGMGDELMREAAAKLVEIASKKHEEPGDVFGNQFTYGDTVVTRAYACTGMVFDAHPDDAKL